MKKTKLLILSTCFLFLSACNSNANLNSTSSNVIAKKENIDTLVMHGSYIKFDEEEELFEEAELVVIAKPTNNFLNREHVIKYMEITEEDDPLMPKTIEDFYTKTPITLIEVLKKPDDETYNTDDEITVIEPIALLFNDTSLQKLSIENYVELEEGNEYIIYLKKNTYGEYGVINMNNGRFNLSADEDIQNLNEHGHENDNEIHQELKEAVQIRFEEEIDTSTSNQ